MDEQLPLFLTCLGIDDCFIVTRSVSEGTPCSSLAYASGYDPLVSNSDQLSKLVHLPDKPAGVNSSSPAIGSFDQQRHLGNSRESAVDDIGEKSRVDFFNGLTLLSDRHLAGGYGLLHAADNCRDVMTAVEAADDVSR